MPCPNKRAHFGAANFDVYDNVYEPAEDSFLFAENLDIRSGDIVLDLGTGSGILAVLAAGEASRVVAVDVNPYAIRCASENAKRNRVSNKIDFIQADLFAGLNENTTFDIILFNAPYLPSEEGEEASWIERSWVGGPRGRKVVDRFISQAPSHLKAKGKILLMQSTLTGVEETIERFCQQELKANITASRKLPFFETLTLIEAKR